MFVLCEEEYDMKGKEREEEEDGQTSSHEVHKPGGCCWLAKSDDQKLIIKIVIQNYELMKIKLCLPFFHQ